MGSIKGIVFDVDGTLVSLRASVGSLYAEALGQHGLALDPAMLDRAVSEVWPTFEAVYLNSSGGYATNPAREVMVWLEFVQRVLEKGAPQLAGRIDVLTAVYSFFARAETRVCVPDSGKVCAALRRRGIVVVAATNNDLRTKAVLRELGLDCDLSQIVTAGEIGWKKPNRRFFEEVAERAGLAPEELLHVGNSRQYDQLAAQDAGMQSLLFDPRCEANEEQVSRLVQILDRV